MSAVSVATTMAPVELQLACLQGMAASGFSPFAPSTFANVMNTNTTLNYHLTGTFVGLDNILEYLSFYSGALWESIVPLGGVSDPAQDLSQSTPEECVLIAGGGAEIRTRPYFTAGGGGGGGGCMQSTLGSVYRYSLNLEPGGGPPTGITLHSWKVWTPDRYMMDYFGLLDSAATGEYICDVLVTTCAKRSHGCGKDPKEGHRNKREFLRGPCDDNQGNTQVIAASSIPASNASTTTKYQQAMNQCLSKYHSLPAMTNTYWADGDSKSCRMLHGIFARKNSFHCPHTTFAFEPDLDGNKKCFQSYQTTVQDLFNAYELELLTAMALPPLSVENDSTSGPIASRVFFHDCPAN